MSYTMEDFKRDVFKKEFARMSLEERQLYLEALPLEERLAGISAEQIQAYLDKLTAEQNTRPRKPRRKT